MIDLSTGYLGLHLRSPLVASASPLSKDIRNLIQLEEAGAAAVVFHSLFEEQINLESKYLDRTLTEGTNSYFEALSYFPEAGAYSIGPNLYLDHIREAKRRLQIPVIGSLNGVSAGGWVRYAKEIEDAGADALELNIYFLPTRADMKSEDVEKMYCDLVFAVKAQVKIPVAVKLAPWFTSMASMAQKLDATGVDALVLFNRFYQPDFDIESLEVVPTVHLSNSDELQLRLHWAALLTPWIRPEIAITGGVHTPADVIKSMMAGAKVVMLASALLRNGVPYLTELERGVVKWMEDHEYESIRQMRGSMNAAAVIEPAAFERANYLKVLGSYTV